MAGMPKRRMRRNPDLLAPQPHWHGEGRKMHLRTADMEPFVQFATRKAAHAASRAIGWGGEGLIPVIVSNLGWERYVIGQHGQWLTKEGYAAALEERGVQRPTVLVSNPYLSKFIPPGGKYYQYVYSEEDVAERHAKKAQKIEGLKSRERALRDAVRRDVQAGDPVALAVGLILTTYERPGNNESAATGHYGVTGWECRHLSFSGRRAIIDYIGKSGVHQTKVISDPVLVAALQDRYRQCSRDGSKILGVSASAVNRYLDSFDVSAKDLRTFGANTEMQKELAKARAAGPNLETLKARDVKKTLKAEFNSALGIVAGRLGHTTSVLRKQYLVQGIEPAYMENGTVLRAFR